MDDVYKATASFYCVEDLSGAVQPFARLQTILESLRLGKPITRLGLAFLKDQNLLSLYQLVVGDISLESFRDLAIIEQKARIGAAAATRLAKEEAKVAREAEMDAQAQAARIKRESDPKYIAAKKNKELRLRYGVVGYVEEERFGRLMSILRKADASLRFSEEDFAWLSSAGEDYFSSEIYTAYHRAEAIAMAQEFSRTRDPWSAISASSHYRKCHQAKDAKELLAKVEPGKLNSNKVKAALYTTCGGVMRDLGEREEAKTLGEKAHALVPKDFRPCTLLGAIHMETGELEIGREWYQKAIERGATHDSVDKELQRIFSRADRAMKEIISAFLLLEDNVRYKWARIKLAKAPQDAVSPGAPYRSCVGARD